MLRKLVLFACLALVAAPPALGAKPPRDKGTILVRFAVPAQAKSVVARLGDSIAGTTATGVTIVRLDRHEQVEAKVARYRKLPGVRYAEPNFIARAVVSDPNDPSLSKQWNLSKIQATAGWGVYPGAYASGNGVRIAIVDTGVDSAHPDLADGRVRTDLGGNCVSSTGCTTGAALDDNGHGTHVAGIAAAATNNAVGVAGLAFDSSLVPVKVLDASGNGMYSSIANGIVWAVDHGARVVNLSLGGTAWSQTLCDAVAAALQRGAIVVAAAGNNGSSAPFYPAACPGSIGVAATTSADALASYSDTGSPNVFLSAPGDSIYSTYRSGGYATMSGTSMATPLVSALSALLAGEGPGRSADDVKRVLATTSDKIGSGYGGDPYGTCSACTWSSSFGYGRINVYRALSQTLPQPDFGVTVTPALSLGQLGGVATATVRVSAFNGFSGTVSLAASGLPGGGVAQFAPSSVSAPGDAGLVIAVPPSAGTGRYIVTITATNGALARTATLVVSVTGAVITGPGPPSGPEPPPPAPPGVSVGAPDFTLQAIPYTQTVARGAATAFVVALTPAGTFTGPVTLSVTGVPEGVSASFAPPLLTAPGKGTLAIAALPSAVAGSYTLTITAASGALVHTATVTLIVS
jgi:thermitase